MISPILLAGLYAIGSLLFLQLLRRITRRLKKWIRAIILSFFVTLLFGFYVPSCYSKYGEVIPTPLIMGIYNPPCHHNAWEAGVYYFLVCWGLAFMLVFVTIQALSSGKP